MSLEVALKLFCGELIATQSLEWLSSHTRISTVLFAFGRTHTICVVFQSRGFYDVPRVLIADTAIRHFRLLAAILDWLRHLASISCWYRPNARQDKFRLSQATLPCEFQKHEVMTMSAVRFQPKKRHVKPSYKATKQIELLSLIWLLVKGIVYQRQNKTLFLF